MAIRRAVRAMLPERMRIRGKRYRCTRAGSVPSMAGVGAWANSARPHFRAVRRPEAQDRKAAETPANSPERAGADLAAVDHAGAQAPTGAAVQSDAERAVQEPEPLGLRCRGAWPSTSTGSISGFRGCGISQGSDYELPYRVAWRDYQAHQWRGDP